MPRCQEDTSAVAACQWQMSMADVVRTYYLHAISLDAYWYGNGGTVKTIFAIVGTTAFAYLAVRVVATVVDVFQRWRSGNWA